MQELTQRLSNTFRDLKDTNIKWQLQSTLAFAKSTYGFTTIYAIDATTQKSIDLQWRKAVAKAYNLPQNGNQEALMRATL
jgi:hypothetical protein